MEPATNDHTLAAISLAAGVSDAIAILKENTAAPFEFNYPPSLKLIHYKPSEINETYQGIRKKMTLWAH